VRARGGPARTHLLIVGQSGRERPLELHHLRILAAELDDLLVARPVAEELEPARRERLVHRREIDGS